MEKFFNIAGPCIPGEHYMLPALDRLPEVVRLISRKQSFVIHAARQSGKTTALMSEFQKFWRENSEADREVYGYKEATPHLVLCAYLQRVVNGGGRISREMVLGSGRLDLCVEYKGHRYALELKLRRNFSHDKSLAQFVGYLDHLGLDEGWMPIFDDDKSKSWEERLYNRDETLNGMTIHVVGL